MLKARASKKPSWPRASVPDLLLYLNYCKYRRRLNAHGGRLRWDSADSPQATARL